MAVEFKVGDDVVEVSDGRAYSVGKVTRVMKLFFEVTNIRGGVVKFSTRDGCPYPYNKRGRWTFRRVELLTDSWVKRLRVERLEFALQGVGGRLAEYLRHLDRSGCATEDKLGEYEALSKALSPAIKLLDAHDAEQEGGTDGRI